MLFGSGSEIGACLDDADHVGSPALGFEKHSVQKKRVFIFSMYYFFLKWNDMSPTFLNLSTS